MIAHIANARTPNSVFLNQASTGSWVALASQSCVAVLFTVQPTNTASSSSAPFPTPNAIMIRRGATGGQIYLREDMSVEVGVRGNANELQIQAVNGTPTVGYECKTFTSG